MNQTNIMKVYGISNSTWWESFLSLLNFSMMKYFPFFFCFFVFWHSFGHFWDEPYFYLFCCCLFSIILLLSRTYNRMKRKVSFFLLLFLLTTSTMSENWWHKEFQIITYEKLLMLNKCILFWMVYISMYVYYMIEFFCCFDGTISAAFVVIVSHFRINFYCCTVSIFSTKLDIKLCPVIYKWRPTRVW